MKSSILIPKGNTQKGVNHQVYQFLQESLDLKRPLKMIDVPCGDGTFATFIKNNHPQVQMIGIDFFADVGQPNFEFHQLSAHDYFRDHKPAQVDALTCISGIMCFDGIVDLFQAFHKSLKSGGVLVVTNDNVMTVRDRLSFLFFGQFKRFKLFYDINEGNWNLVLPQALRMLLARHEFKNIKIKYTSIYTEDYLFLPLAILIYPLFFIYLMTRKSSISRSERRKLFPFQALLARHYVIFGEK